MDSNVGMIPLLTHFALPVPLDELIFASKVKKTNMFEWTQERVLAITNNAIYNIHKKQIKRMININDIGGMTKTIPPSKNT